jgi:HEAT repeat protein/cyclophilin family peptidyl-prolyl cis-trans isomerase
MTVLANPVPMSRASLAACLVFFAGCAPSPPVAVPRPPEPADLMSWILRLEDERRLADPAPAAPAGAGVSTQPSTGFVPPRPDLLALLEAPEAHLRRRAALAVGRVGLPEGVDALVGLLVDPEPEVRQMAAFALGLIGDAVAVDVLVDALADSAPAVQGRAAQALGRLGADSAAPAIGAMVRRHVTSAFDLDPDDMTYPQGAEVEAFRLGLYALGELKAFEPLAEAVLGEDGRPILWWWPVAYALGRTQDPRTLPALLTLAGVRGSVGVALAAKGLGALGAPDGIEALTDLLSLERRHRVVVLGAVRALGEMDDPRAAEELDRFVRIRGLDRQLRRAAVDALANHARQASVEVFVELLGHPWPPLRAASVRALSRVDPERLLFVLSGLGSDPDWRVRAAVAEGLGHTSPASARATLEAMLDDGDQRVLPAVLDALVAVEAPEASSLLLDRLQAPDVVVRGTAARLLAELRPPEADAALAAAYEAAKADASFLARAAIVDALAAYGSDPALETLALALEDRDWPVRVRAAEHLASLEPESNLAAAIRPAQGLRRVDHAAPHLTNPQVSPHVYIETARGTIEIELAVLDAPLTAESFTTLVRQGFFDGLTFHRVLPGEAVHSGDPRSDDNGGAGFTLRDEPNQLPFLRGTVGLARGRPDTGGSRFFITLAPQPQLDGRYTAFGRVVAGMEAADALQTGDRIDRVLVWDGVQPFGGAAER